MERYFPPAFNETSFNCPYCEVKAAQVWFAGTGKRSVQGGTSTSDFTQLRISVCTHCHEPAFWVDAEMVHPAVTTAPPANVDLPQEVRDDYAEAAAIVTRSPRGAAALLRLCVQNLCIHLGQPGKNINDDIRELVKKGLDPHVQQALDALRVIGNNAVHPLEMDLRDDAETAAALFDSINFIAEQMITNRKKIELLFSKLPSGAKEAIKKRDA